MCCTRCGTTARERGCDGHLVTALRSKSSSWTTSTQAYEAVASAEEGHSIRYIVVAPQRRLVMTVRVIVRIYCSVSDRLLAWLTTTWAQSHLASRWLVLLASAVSHAAAASSVVVVCSHL